MLKKCELSGGVFGSLSLSAFVNTCCRCKHKLDGLPRCRLGAPFHHGQGHASRKASTTKCLKFSCNRSGCFSA